MRKNQTLPISGLHSYPNNCNPALAHGVRPAGRPPTAKRPSLVILILVTVLLTSVQAQPVDWATGDEFDEQLQAGIGIRWAGISLRGALDRLSRNQRVAIFLDRRVDPDQQIEFASPTITLEDLVEGVAAHVKQGTCHVGDVVYVGPQPTSAVLATVTELKHDEAERLPATVRTRLQRRERLRWPMLSTPRELIERLAEDVGMRVVGVETIPHDLWPEVDLPPMTFAQRMGLVLAGFHLTFEYAPDGSAVRLIPLPEQAVLRRSYPIRPNQSTLVRSLPQRVPGVQVSSAAGRITVTGTWQQHELVQRLLQGRQSKPVPGGVTEENTRFTLRVESKPIQAVAMTVAARINRQLEFDPTIADKAGLRVSFDLQEATLDELLRATLQPAGLSYELDNETLRIVPGR